MENFALVLSVSNCVEGGGGIKSCVAWSWLASGMIAWHFEKLKEKKEKKRGQPPFFSVNTTAVQGNLLLKI